ncbi:MAG: HypC/HybG/HupF family hydrogenase formation chaperone [Armatimonadetes bacterium]|nr:HypC/HybG/HupF family hydrogenase formation chaperone [Armatimonadota bacterium]
MCLAIPGKVSSIQEKSLLERTGQVAFGSISKEVNLAFVPEANVGDYVMVHVGVAISVIDEAEAQQVFEYLERMEELAELQDQSSP